MGTAQLDENAVKHELAVWDKERRMGKFRNPTPTTQEKPSDGADEAWRQDLDAALKKVLSQG